MMFQGSRSPEAKWLIFIKGGFRKQELLVPLAVIQATWVTYSSLLMSCMKHDEKSSFLWDFTVSAFWWCNVLLINAQYVIFLSLKVAEATLFDHSKWQWAWGKSTGETEQEIKARCKQSPCLLCGNNKHNKGLLRLSLSFAHYEHSSLGIWPPCLLCLTFTFIQTRT